MNDTLIPDACHIRKRDAHDLAQAVVETIAHGVRRIWLYVGADGAVGVSLTENPMESFALVGTYDEQATRTDIEDDILASQREAIA